MRPNEHIVLESIEWLAPSLRAVRKVHARLQLHSRLRRHFLELSLIDYYFLGVRTTRGNGGASEYVLDLRLVDPALQCARHISWRWMATTLGFAAMFFASAWYVGSSPVHWWRHPWTPVCASLFVLALCAGFVSIYRTTETFAVYSAHGQAKLVQFTGGLGTFRRLHQFKSRLAAHLRMAGNHRLPKAERLRYEMRDHFRLKEAGVLPEIDYEKSKRLILSQHG